MFRICKYKNNCIYKNKKKKEYNLMYLPIIIEYFNVYT